MHRTRLLLVPLAIPLLFVACSSNDPAPDPKRLGQEVEVGTDGVRYAPIPFTAEQIREQCADGYALTFRVAERGGPAVLQHMSFSESDDEGVRVTSRTLTEEGEPAGEPQSARSEWSELRMHAAFPAAATLRVRDRVTTRAGRFDCWCYVVAGPEGQTSRFWFADSMPGPPVRFDRERDGEMFWRMELIGVERP